MVYSEPLPGDSESQATQLLHDVLDGGVHTSLNTNTADGPIDDQGVSKDFSSDSHTSPTRNSNSAPRYHFHGLATTQTQSQYEDSGGDSGGSQKENINTPNELKQASSTTSQPRSASPHASSSKNTGKVQPSHVNQPPSCATTTKSKTATIKAVSFQHPRPATTSAAPHTATTALPLPKPQPAPPTPRPTRPRFNRNSSQDSFGGAVSQDLERQFLAQSKQFEVPLSELGRVSYSTQETSTRSTPTVAKKMTSKSGMFAYSVPTGRTPAALSPPGTVLVAATPSNSDSSHSQSQSSQQWESQDPNLFACRQPPDASYDSSNIDINVGAQSQASTQSQLSSSYERLLAGEEDTATQIVNDYQATQPATQLDESSNTNEEVEAMVAQLIGPMDAADSEENTRTSNNDHTSDENLWVSPVVPPSMSGASTAPPRSLLRMVNPHKQWRLQNPTGEVAQWGGERVGQPILEETQIVYDLPTPSSAIAKVGTRQSISGHSRASGFSDGYPGRELLNRKRNEDPLPRRLPLQMPSETDINEVVPDSEPLCDQEYGMSTPVPTPLPSANERTKSIAKRPFREIDPSSEPEAGSGEIVPDSVLMEEEEEEEDEDVPLAVVTKSRTEKGVNLAKGKEKDKNAPASRTGGAAMAPPPSVPKGKQKLVASVPTEGSRKRTQAPKSTSRAQPHSDTKVMPDPRQSVPPAQVPGRSWEAGEVPSSLPEQDGKVAGVHGRRRAETAKSKAAGKAKAPNSRKTRSTSAAPKKRRRIASDTEDDDGSETDELALIPKMEKEEEEETEPADEDYMDFQDDDSSRKPKRGAANVKANPRALRTRPRNAHANTPSIRPGKRLRSVASASASRIAHETATKVFALWKQDGHYYSGTVHSHHSGTKYIITFDDDTQDGVDITRLRRSELIEGDNVILVDGGQKAKVVDITQRDTKGLVRIETDNGGVAFDVEMSDLRIATRTITRQWADRTLNAESIMTAVKPLKSPSPSKLSVMSVNSTKAIIRGKPLSKTGFVVTLSVGNENWESDKDKLMSAIKVNGGTVIDDWTNIFRMDGKHTHSQKRWVVHKDEVEWAGREDMDRVFLLADDANLKPKYLIALALGIPCLSVNWLYDSVNEGEKDWQAYLLPQGFSEPLNARVSQFVDLDWCNSLDHLNDIMSNHVASKLFADKSVLCLGEDFVPLPKNKKSTTDAEKAKEASRMVPRIILAMGAERVEAVADLKFTTNNLSTFDYVVIKDYYDFVPALRSATMCVHLPWVKDCLIAGRLLPLPEW